MKKNTAFTLAETMLVLAIIGVLVAFLIPILHKTRPDESVMVYRKAFYTIEEAIRNLTNDTKLYTAGDLKQPTTGTASNYNQTFCKNIGQTINTIGSITCRTTSSYTAGTDLASGEVNLTLANGADIGGLDQKFNTSTNSIDICIDVNGVGIGEDKGCSKASVDTMRTDKKKSRQRDQFRLRIRNDGKISIGYIDTDKYNWGSEYAMLINPRGLSRFTHEDFLKNLKKVDCLHAYSLNVVTADKCLDTTATGISTYTEKYK